jgi:hypothetical protein
MLNLLKQLNLVDYVWNKENHTWDEHVVQIRPAIYNPFALINAAVVGWNHG